MDDAAARTSISIHASERGSWRISHLRPGAAPRPYVERITAYAERDTNFVRRREVPNGRAMLVFNLGSDLRVEHPVPTATVFTAGRGFYTGISDRYAITETDRAQEGVQVALTPLGARVLLDRPLEEVGDRLIDPRDLFGSEAEEWVERVRNAGEQQERTTILENVLVARLSRVSRAVPDDLVWALGKIEATCGAVTIEALASRMRCSRKHLTVRFRREFGVTPKRFARVLRFARAIKDLGTGGVANAADLAYFRGYADQAHMTRDFQEFAGSAPSAFLRRRLPDGGGFTD